MKWLVEYINNLFGLEDGNTTATTLIITLFVFLAGYLLQWLSRFVTDESKKRALREDIRIILNKSLEDVSSQSENFKNFYESLNMKTIIHRLKQEPISHLNTFNEYSYADLRSAFLDVFYRWGFWELIFNRRKYRSRRGDLNELYKLIGRLEQLEEKYPNDMIQLFERMNKYEEKWGENMEEIQNLYDEGRIKAYRMEKGALEKEDEFYSFMIEANKIWIKWAETEDQLQFKIAKEKFIDPLLELNRKHPLKGDITLKSYKYLLGATYAYSNLEIVFSELKETFEGYHKSYNSIYRKITRIETIN